MRLKISSSRIAGQGQAGERQGAHSDAKTVFIHPTRFSRAYLQPQKKTGRVIMTLIVRRMNATPYLAQESQ